MSKKARRVVIRLQHETAVRVQTVATLLREYRNDIHNNAPGVPDQQTKRMREVKRVVAEYMQLQKQLRRVRRKAQLER